MTVICESLKRGAKECYKATVHGDMSAYCEIEDTPWELPYFLKKIGEDVVIGVRDYLRRPLDPFKSAKEHVDEDMKNHRVFTPVFTVLAEPLMVKAASAIFGHEVETFYNANIFPIRELQFYYYAFYKWRVD